MESDIVECWCMGGSAGGSNNNEFNGAWDTEGGKRGGGVSAGLLLLTFRVRAMLKR